MATRYQLRKRTAQQLEAMRPVKRTRKSVVLEERGDVDTIDKRRTTATGLEYRVTWLDDSNSVWLPRNQLIEDGNANLIETVGAYYQRYPNQEVTYQAFISRNARAYSAIADNEDNSCLPHAIQMALELLGYQHKSEQLPSIWTQYLEDAVKAKVPLDEGFHKTSEIVRYCIKGVSKTLGDCKTRFPGDNGVRVLEPGVYIVGAFKRNMRAHCFAMHVTEDEDIIVREERIDSGIGDQTWLRMIEFIRRVKVKQNSSE
ncbi:hypothetical protein CCR75_000506 [Bremia lactucae]|uniref:Chromo domain-containing protein n=1 Tax=Bremia lactucae TaxID=4779 RepID=A0A976ILF7_BRELC|nr:hypothetical protein CCR75_000506 [Bremia lactucae]